MSHLADECQTPQLREGTSLSSSSSTVVKADSFFATAVGERRVEQVANAASDNVLDLITQARAAVNMARQEYNDRHHHHSPTRSTASSSSSSSLPDHGSVARQLHVTATHVPRLRPISDCFHHLRQVFPEGAFPQQRQQQHHLAADCANHHHDDDALQHDPRRGPTSISIMNNTVRSPFLAPRRPRTAAAAADGTFSSSSSPSSARPSSSSHHYYNSSSVPGTAAAVPSTSPHRTGTHHSPSAAAAGYSLITRRHLPNDDDASEAARKNNSATTTTTTPSVRRSTSSPPSASASPASSSVAAVATTTKTAATPPSSKSTTWAFRAAAPSMSSPSPPTAGGGRSASNKPSVYQHLYRPATASAPTSLASPSMDGNENASSIKHEEKEASPSRDAGVQADETWDPSSSMFPYNDGHHHRRAHDNGVQNDTSPTDDLISSGRLLDADASEPQLGSFLVKRPQHRRAPKASTLNADASELPEGNAKDNTTPTPFSFSAALHHPWSLNDDKLSNGNSLRLGSQSYHHHGDFRELSATTGGLGGLASPLTAKHQAPRPPALTLVEEDDSPVLYHPDFPSVFVSHRTLIREAGSQLNSNDCWDQGLFLKCESGLNIDRHAQLANWGSSSTSISSTNAVAVYDVPLNGSLHVFGEWLFLVEPTEAPNTWDAAHKLILTRVWSAVSCTTIAASEAQQDILKTVFDCPAKFVGVAPPAVAATKPDESFFSVWARPVTVDGSGVAPELIRILCPADQVYEFKMQIEAAIVTANLTHVVSTLPAVAPAASSSSRKTNDDAQHQQHHQTSQQLSSPTAAASSPTTAIAIAIETASSDIFDEAIQKQQATSPVDDNSLSPAQAELLPAAAAAAAASGLVVLEEELFETEILLLPSMEHISPVLSPQRMADDLASIQTLTTAAVEAVELVNTLEEYRMQASYDPIVVCAGGIIPDASTVDLALCLAGTQVHGYSSSSSSSGGSAASSAAPPVGGSTADDVALSSDGTLFAHVASFLRCVRADVVALSPYDVSVCSSSAAPGGGSNSNSNPPLGDHHQSSNDPSGRRREDQLGKSMSSGGATTSIPVLDSSHRTSAEPQQQCQLSLNLLLDAAFTGHVPSGTVAAAAASSSSGGNSGGGGGGGMTTTGSFASPLIGSASLLCSADTATYIIQRQHQQKLNNSTLPDYGLNRGATENTNFNRRSPSGQGAGNGNNNSTRGHQEQLQQQQQQQHATSAAALGYQGSSFFPVLPTKRISTAHGDVVFVAILDRKFSGVIKTALDARSPSFLFSSSSPVGSAAVGDSSSSTGGSQSQQQQQQSWSSPASGTGQTKRVRAVIGVVQLPHLSSQDVRFFNESPEWRAAFDLIVGPPLRNEMLSATKSSCVGGETPLPKAATINDGDDDGSGGDITASSSAAAAEQPSSSSSFYVSMPSDSFTDVVMIKIQAAPNAERAKISLVTTILSHIQHGFSAAASGALTPAGAFTSVRADSTIGKHSLGGGGGISSMRQLSSQQLQQQQQHQHHRDHPGADGGALVAELHHARALYLRRAFEWACSRICRAINGPIARFPPRQKTAPQEQQASPDTSISKTNVTDFRVQAVATFVANCAAEAFDASFAFMGLSTFDVASMSSLSENVNSLRVLEWCTSDKFGLVASSSSASALSSNSNFIMRHAGASATYVTQLCAPASSLPWFFNQCMTLAPYKALLHRTSQQQQGPTAALSSAAGVDGHGHGHDAVVVPVYMYASEHLSMVIRYDDFSRSATCHSVRIGDIFVHDMHREAMVRFVVDTTLYTELLASRKLLLEEHGITPTIAGAPGSTVPYLRSTAQYPFSQPGSLTGSVDASSNAAPVIKSKLLALTVIQKLRDMNAKRQQAESRNGMYAGDIVEASPSPMGEGAGRDPSSVLELQQQTATGVFGEPATTAIASATAGHHPLPGAAKRLSVSLSRRMSRRQSVQQLMNNSFRAFGGGGGTTTNPLTSSFRVNNSSLAMAPHLGTSGEGFNEEFPAAATDEALSDTHSDVLDSSWGVLGSTFGGVVDRGATFTAESLSSSTVVSVIHALLLARKVSGARGEFDPVSFATRVAACFEKLFSSDTIASVSCRVFMVEESTEEFRELAMQCCRGSSSSSPRRQLLAMCERLYGDQDANAAANVFPPLTVIGDDDDSGTNSRVSTPDGDASVNKMVAKRSTTRPQGDAAASASTATAKRAPSSVRATNDGDSGGFFDDDDDEQDAAISPAEEQLVFDAQSRRVVVRQDRSMAIPLVDFYQGPGDVIAVVLLTREGFNDNSHKGGGGGGGGGGSRTMNTRGGGVGDSAAAASFLDHTSRAPPMLAATMKEGTVGPAGAAKLFDPNLQTSFNTIGAASLLGITIPQMTQDGHANFSVDDNNTAVAVQRLLCRQIVIEERYHQYLSAYRAITELLEAFRSLSVTASANVIDVLLIRLAKAATRVMSCKKAVTFVAFSPGHVMTVDHHQSTSSSSVRHGGGGGGGGGAAEQQEPNEKRTMRARRLVCPVDGFGDEISACIGNGRIFARDPLRPTAAAATAAAAARDHSSGTSFAQQRHHQGSGRTARAASVTGSLRKRKTIVPRDKQEALSELLQQLRSSPHEGVRYLVKDVSVLSSILAVPLVQRDANTTTRIIGVSFFINHVSRSSSDSYIPFSPDDEQFALAFSQLTARLLHANREMQRLAEYGALESDRFAKLPLVPQKFRTFDTKQPHSQQQQQQQQQHQHHRVQWTDRIRLQIIVSPTSPTTVKPSSGPSRAPVVASHADAQPLFEFEDDDDDDHHVSFMPASPLVDASSGSKGRTLLSSPVGVDGRGGRGPMSPAEVMSHSASLFIQKNRDRPLLLDLDDDDDDDDDGDVSDAEEEFALFDPHDEEFEL